MQPSTRNFFPLCSLLAVVFFGIVLCAAQRPTSAAKTSTTVDLQPIRSSPAYADLLLQKTELESTLDSLLVDYTEEYPKVKATRNELKLLQAELDRLLAVKPENSARLTDALGRLMLRKIDLEAQLETLRNEYKDDHPEVRKLKAKIDRYEAAIKEILG